MRVFGKGIIAGLGGALALWACDGAGLEGHARMAADAVDTGPGLDIATPTPLVPVPAEVELTPVAPPEVPDVPDVPAGPLPGGTTDGDGVVVAKSALEGRFLYGVGADPSGVLASLGGTAAGLAPLRAVVELEPDGAGGGRFVVRALDPETQAPVPGADGLVEAYPYMEVDAQTIRVDFERAEAALEIGVYGGCRYALSDYTLAGAPVYADGLLTWPAQETYERAGQCQYVPREMSGLHVHYLRHADAGRGFVPRRPDAEPAFGFFLAGESDAPWLARLPGLAADEPARTHTYYLSPSFPEAFVPAAEETFEAWNDALEETVGRRPFAVARAPEGMIAWDPRYHVVLWDGSSGAGAVAPFSEDPDTGEIFQSFVVMWFGELERLVDRYDGFFDLHPELVDVYLPPSPAASLPGDPFAPAAFLPASRRPLYLPARVLVPRTFVKRPYDPRPVRAEVARQAALGVELDDAQVSHMIVVDFLLHEVGHNLGLRHNFIGSVDHQRHDASHSASSTMDYVIGMLEPGSYDRDAMRYAYGATAPERQDYLYCTDETIELEPACIQWDWGHPIRHQIGVVDAYLAAYPEGAASGAVGDFLDEGTFDDELTRLRAMVNSVYESWDVERVDTLEELLARVDCGEGCVGHLALRQKLALYLLYARHLVTAYWEEGAPDVWLDFPALDDTQAARVMATYFELVTTREEPLGLKTTIIAKLPTSLVKGAPELLAALSDWFTGKADLTQDEQRVKAAVEDALEAL